MRIFKWAENVKRTNSYINEDEELATELEDLLQEQIGGPMLVDNADEQDWKMALVFAEAVEEAMKDTDKANFINRVKKSLADKKG